MSARRVLVLAALAASLVAGCGSDAEEGSTPLATAVERHLAYLDPQSSAVIALDVRFDGPNWKHLREHAERGLAAYRAAAPADETEIPRDVSQGLQMLVDGTGLSFETDIRPVLDGHLVVGVVQPPVAAGGEPEEVAETIFVFRTEGDGLERVVERLAGERPKPHPRRDDVRLYGETALVGDDTLVWAIEGDDEDGSRERALDRADQEDAGFPPERLAGAERSAGLEDPFVLAAADPTLARAFVAEPNFRRALDEVPWLGAIRSLSGAVRIDADGAELAGVIATDASQITTDDLPLAPAGDLDLPRTDGVAGASRDQSFTTTFLSRTVRALFADSGFAKAVQEAERDLGVRFEDEVLRQFSCPSMSEMLMATGRFGARSCVKDPERMRELLPKLSQHLPRIIRTMQNLDDEGLLTLLLIAPDAPLTPSFAPVAQIQVRPSQEGDRGEETLYEVTGLRSNRESEIAAAGPDRVVFGMIGDAFVVASDHEMARRAARLEGERVDGEAASAIRAPLGALLEAGEGEDDTDPAEAALFEFLGAIEVTASADREGLRARGRLDLGD